VLCHFSNNPWWYMEIPRTGSTTIDRNLRHLFKDAHAIYQKHWPIVPEPCYPELVTAPSIVSIRNPYSRAVSCWQFFTVPGSITFLDWLKQRLEQGFTDIAIEARPQAFWYRLNNWTHVIRQETMDQDFWTVVKALGVSTQYQLTRLNDINGPWVNRCRVKTARSKPWPEYYCEAAKEVVLRLYAEDFSYLEPFYSKTFPSSLD